MKKLYLLLLAVICSVGMNWADNYLPGSWHSNFAIADNVKFVDGQLTLTLAANTTYEFKIYDNAYGNNTWYGNSGRMTFTNCSGWTFENNNNTNAKFLTTAAGEYKFNITWNGSTPSLSVEYPEFYLHGEWNDWVDVKFDANHMLALHLTPGQYGFKVHAGSQWFSNLGTMNVGNIGWNFDNRDQAAGNCTLNITEEGDYVFTLGWNENFPMLGFYKASSNIMSASTTPIKADEGADGNLGSRWASIANDYEWWMIKYSEQKTFNTVKIVWEGAWTKDFDLLGSNDGTNWTTIKEVRDQNLSGFPNTQIYDLGDDVTYQYVKFFAKLRGTGYGNSFWEFDAYHAETQVLTSFDFKAAASICKVGANVALTATPKDQYGVEMNETVSFVVTPAEAGHVANGVYYADAFGPATITATCGTLPTKEINIFNYTGENVALNKTVTAEGYNDASRLVDGNDGTEWQGDPNNGGAEHNVTCGFTIDLGALYNLNLVTIHFEGACSEAYTLEVSADNTNWETAHNYSGANGINNHTDFLYGANLENANGVRYVKFSSTKNATDWGMKIYEFQAFGVEAAPTEPVASVSLDKTAATLEVGQSLTLVKTVLPATADQHVTWSVAPANIVKVENGVVKALAEGEATVTATSATDNTKSASCTITVVPSTAKTYYEVKEDKGNKIIATYAITWENDAVTYRVAAQHEKTDFVCQVNDGNWNDANPVEGVFTYTSNKEYELGDTQNGFIYMPYAGGAGRVDYNYTVGSTSAPYTLTDQLVGEWYTICLPFDATIEGATLYSISSASNEAITVSEAGTEAKAGKAYLYKPTATTVTATYTAVAAHTADTYLTGNLSATPLVLDADDDVYILDEDNKFHHIEGDATATINQYKAYLKVPAAAAAAPARALRIVEGPAVATDLESVDANSAVKFFENGQLFIKKNGVVYTVMGQIVK